MTRRAGILIIIGTTVVGLFSCLVMIVVVAVALTSISSLHPGQIVSAPPSATTPSSSPVTGNVSPSGDGRRAEYAFGHTAAVVPVGGTGIGTELTERIPFIIDADVTHLRLHARNWNYTEDRPLAGTIDISSIAVGRAASGVIPGDNSAFSTAPAVLSTGTRLVDGAEFTSDWVTADQVGFDSGEPSFLSLGWKAQSGTEIGVASDVSWLLPTSNALAATTAESIGEFNMTGSFLDMWLEYEYAGDEPSIVVVGHSLNSGANANVAEHPHTGESDAWHQIWAETEGGVASSLSVPGSWTAHFAPGSPKWSIYQGLSPDAYVQWSASNDIAGGTELSMLKSEWLATLQTAEGLWPDAKVFAFTEPPRGLTGQLEQNRHDWNAWLLSTPAQNLGVDTVVDIDALVKDPADSSRLNPALNGDDSHMSPQGNRVVAAAFACAFSGAGC